MTTTNSSQTLVLTSKQNGIVIIPVGSALTRLNYFDGKFLRASDLKAEQDYLRELVQQSNQAGGSGVAHGFDVSLGGGDMLNIGPGLAIDGEGRVLLMPQETSIRIQDLIDKSRDLQQLYGKAKTAANGNFGDCEMKGADPPDNTTHPNAIYKIVISPAEALCGEEDVYGRLCEDACATSTDRPFAVEGLVVRAVPLESPVPTPKDALTQIYLRSRVASGYFEYERNLVTSLISAEGIKQRTWCLGADAGADGGVPIGVIARAGATTVFLDPWIVRRELIDTPARRYWQWRMMMRPWDVFLAQILQFQCQLRDLYRTFPDPGIEVTPCDGARDVINEAATAISEIRKYYEATTARFVEIKRDLIPFEGGANRLSTLNLRLETIHKALSAMPADRWLINGGIVELPSAGYLPVVPDGNATVNQQVRRMMGEGVELRFCVVPPDYVAHALEEAQHMERISLTKGIENPKQRPEVDILVPSGQIIDNKQAPVHNLFEATVTAGLSSSVPLAGVEMTSSASLANQSAVKIDGAARTESLPSGGGEFYLAGQIQMLEPLLLQTATVSAKARKSAARQAPGSSAGVDDKVMQTLFGGLSRIIGKAVGAEAKRTNAGAPKPARAAAPAPAVEILTGNRRNGQPDAVWLELRCERDIFKLESNDSSEVRLRGFLAGFGQDIVNVEVSLGGEFLVVTSASAPGSDGKVGGKLSVDGFARAVVPGGATPPQEEPLRFENALTIEPGELSAGLRSVKIELQRGALGFEFTTAWGDEPMQIDGKLEIVYPKNRRKIMTSRFRANPAVFELNNDSHQEAVSALEMIGEGIDDGFAERKTRVLFPPLPPPSDELIVRGTEDWVLFHRRRTKSCNVAAVAAPTRRYRVYQCALTPEHLKDVGGSGDLIPKSPLTDAQISNFSTQIAKAYLPIGEATFGSGVATLVGDTSALTTAWKKIPNGMILWGAIGSRGDALTDGSALAQFRLKALESKLDPVSPDARADVLPIIPPSLSSPDVDGVILLLNGAKPTIRKAFVIYASFDNPTHFPNKDATSGTVLFDDNVPRGDALVKVIESLRPKTEVVKGVMLATIALVDPGAGTRLSAVVGTLGAVQSLPAANFQSRTGLLTETDKEQLTKIGVSFAGFDEVIYLEPNPPSA